MKTCDTSGMVSMARTPFWPTRSRRNCITHGPPQRPLRDFPNHADDGRLERQRVRPDAREARLGETGRDLAARSHCRLRRGAGAPRLGDDGDPSAGPHEALELFQPLVRLTPHAQVVHSQDLVKRLRERRKVLGRPATQRHAARAYGVRVAPGRLPNHDFRVIDTTHKTLRRPAAQFPDRDPRSEADLKDAVAWLYPEQANGPHVALAVRRPQGHLPPDKPAYEPAGPHELRPDRHRQLLLPVHDLRHLPFESLSPLAPNDLALSGRRRATLA